jgi:hypothetical protein
MQGCYGGDLCALSEQRRGRRSVLCCRMGWMGSPTIARRRKHADLWAALSKIFSPCHWELLGFLIYHKRHSYGPIWPSPNALWLSPSRPGLWIGSRLNFWFFLLVDILAGYRGSGGGSTPHFLGLFISLSLCFISCSRSLFLLHNHFDYDHNTD